MYREYKQNVAVSGGSYKLELKVHVLNTGDPDFVIAEIFIPGTYNEAGAKYNGDQYIRIYNNPRIKFCMRMD